MIVHPSIMPPPTCSSSTNLTYIEMSYISYVSYIYIYICSTEISSWQMQVLSIPTPTPGTALVNVINRLCFTTFHKQGLYSSWWPRSSMGGNWSLPSPDTSLTCLPADTLLALLHPKAGLPQHLPLLVFHHPAPWRHRLCGFSLWSFAQSSYLDPSTHWWPPNAELQS